MDKNQAASRIQTYLNENGFYYNRFDQDNDVFWATSVGGIRPDDDFRVIMNVSGEHIGCTTATPLAVPAEGSAGETAFLRKMADVNAQLRFGVFCPLGGKLVFKVVYPSCVLETGQGDSLIHMLFYLAPAMFYKHFASDALPG